VERKLLVTPKSTKALTRYLLILTGILILNISPIPYRFYTVFSSFRSHLSSELSSFLEYTRLFPSPLYIVSSIVRSKRSNPPSNSLSVLNYKGSIVEFLSV
jgi:hypothetical protein